MRYNKKKNKYFLAAILAFVLVAGVFAPVANSKDIEHIEGFESGPSYTSVIPMKKTTFVNFDKESLVDDFAYLAAVPTSVFPNNGNLVAHPLVFYEDEYEIEEDKERSLNTYQGLDYFMTDWQEFCSGEFDQLTLINLNKGKVDQWGNAKDYVEISEDNAIDIANELALNDWSYSDDAVVAVIEEEYDNPEIKTSGSVDGTLDSYNIDKKTLTVARPPIGVGGSSKKFEINDKNYKYVVTKMSWNEKIDYDLQLFDDELGMVQAAAGTYSSPFPYEEICSSYIHNYKDWYVSVSAVPKKGAGESFDELEEMYLEDPTPTGILGRAKNTIDVEVFLYPGTKLNLEPIPFGVRDVELKLKWNNPGVHLGMTLLDPIGTEIASTITHSELIHGEIESEETEITLPVQQLGETMDDESYSVCVFAVKDVESDLDFTIEYSWQQNFTREHGDSLAGAANAAVLASSLNAPLLYIKTDSIQDTTIDTLYKLGVENIHLVNFGSNLEKSLMEDLKDVGEVSNYNEPIKIYDKIREITGENDVIFTTIDPWDYWYVNERIPAGTYEGALHIGPAALIAAHHGSPVLVVDVHPKLSQAVAWATDWWNKNAISRFTEPSAGSLTLTAHRAYEFLEENGFGKIEDGDITKQNQEVIITVAGQFEIGTPWDRSFTGAGLPGRFWSSPVDSAYVICRNLFYPAMIFVNPGMEGVKFKQGSKSTIEPFLGRIKAPRGVNLVVHDQGEPEIQYPVLQTYNTFQYRFNEKAYKHWKFRYVRADGIIPYLTPSDELIDDGAAITKEGKYYPDQSESEVIPFYCNQAGYGNVFSTNFDYVTENLNQGVLIWVINSHGMFTNGGMLGMWNPESPYVYEENPWRAYEPVLWKPGHLRTYLHWLLYYYYELAKLGLGMDVPILKTLSEIRPIKFQLFSEVGCTEEPDVCAINPQLIYANKLWKPIKSTVYMHDLWGAVGVMIYRDRLLEPIKNIKEGYPLINWYAGDGKVTISPASGSEVTQTWRVAYEFDDAIDNLHSCGINTISCLPANTFLHQTWMRHGATYQVIDPWTTTDWSASWTQMLIKLFAMGYTLGEAYERGMRAVGPQYSVEDGGWWDVWENVCLFGDPNLRVFVPNDEWDKESKNTWDRPNTLSAQEDLDLDGHMPFGATDYPNAKEPSAEIPMILIIIIILILLVIIIGVGAASRKKGKK
jgi:hypothetical protein